MPKLWDTEGMLFTVVAGIPKYGIIVVLMFLPMIQSILTQYLWIFNNIPNS